MIQEQRNRIYEKQKILNQLEQYTESMLELVNTITEFNNDYCFSSAAFNNDMNLTIYNVDLQTLLGENAISHQMMEWNLLSNGFLIM